MTEAGWDSQRTALMYHEYTQRYESYRVLARALADLAGVRPGMDVVDLGCGTGVLTAELGRRLEGRGRLIGVDASPAMLAVARTAVAGPEIEWTCCRAEDLTHSVRSPVDAILCSAAIWQTRLPAALAAARTCLRPQGVLAFNLPELYFPGLFPLGPRPSSPSLLQRMVAVATLDYDYVGVGRPGQASPVADLDTLRALLLRAGLDMETWEHIEVRLTPASERDWLRIPVTTDRVFPDHDYPTRMAMLHKALADWDPPPAQPERWILLRCRAQGGEGS